VAKTIEQDLEILSAMADWITTHSNLGQLYDLPAFLSEFSFRLRNELDYVREGQNANLFRKNFADDKSVYIPFIYWDLTTPQVITMERVYGIKINDVAAMKRLPKIPGVLPCGSFSSLVSSTPTLIPAISLSSPTAA
jgi:ubiquinone biosynthesis protein